MPLEDARKALAIGLLKPETVKLLAEDNKLAALHNEQESWVLDTDGFTNLRLGTHLDTRKARSKGHPRSVSPC